MNPSDAHAPGPTGAIEEAMLNSTTTTARLPTPFTKRETGLATSKIFERTQFLPPAHRTTANSLERSPKAAGRRWRLN
jgi:hypothetical protein